MIHIPSEAVFVNWPGAVMWFDRDGIVYAIGEKAPAQTLEEARKAIADFKQLTGGRKQCMMLDITKSSPASKAVRDYMAKEMSEIAIAVALLSGSALGRMIANLFLKIKPPDYPARIFSSEEQAHAWLLTFVDSKSPVSTESVLQSN